MNVRSALLGVFGFVTVIWIVELVNLAFGHRLSQWGVVPRTTGGLIGIPLSPFLHHGPRHAMANTLPLLVLGGLVSLHGRTAWISLSLFLIILGGSALWLLGRGGNHVGASGLIFGYFGFLLANGWYHRSLASVLIAVTTLFLYGGLIWGLLPSGRTISWEGHLFGFVAGVIAARLQKRASTR